MPTQQELKQQAALRAADLVQSGMVVGLGTGSTAALFIAELIERAKKGLKITCIPTSERSAAQAAEGGLTVVGFDQIQFIDLAVDGADEITRAGLDLIKGLGGALLREKIVASAARQFVVIADDTKLVDRLGMRAPVPIEVTQFAHELTALRLLRLGATVTLRKTTTGRYLTDGGNYILDCAFGRIEEPAALNTTIRAIPGVIETGIFAGMTSKVILAGADGIIELTS